MTKFASLICAIVLGVALVGCAAQEAAINSAKNPPPTQNVATDLANAPAAAQNPAIGSANASKATQNTTVR